VSTTELAINVRGLRKRYGALDAVAGIDLDVARGEVFALLGPNGAGKTTTVEILEGYRARSAGDVRVLGHDPERGERAYRERIGIVLQATGVDPYLTVEETVAMFGGYYPRPRPVGEVLERVGLTAQRATPVRRLSGGQQRRLDVAVGLAGDPELLFLDEPTTGFDPGARRHAWELVEQLRALGKTVLLTTHYLDEAEQLADRVAIIARGRLVAAGTPGELGAGGGATAVSFTLPPGAPAPPPELGAAPEASGGWRMESAEPTRALYELTRWALEQRVALGALEVRRASLEDVYLRLVAAAEAEAERAAEPVR
jgi:ABC-2 type transport system ATP-binding protein